MRSPLPLTALFDDASQFPPSALLLQRAVAEHGDWRGGRRSDLVGRLLVPLDRVPSLAFIAADCAWDLGLIVPRDADPAAGGEAVSAWRAAFSGARLFLEGHADVVAKASSRGVGAKIRCGGVVRGAVPDTDAVVEFIAACANHRIPFKATAGLHRPLRHRADDVGEELYGFLNLWVATALALEHAPAEAIREALMAGDVETLGLGRVDLAAAREVFTAFGTCSITEPIDALVELRLLDG